MNLMECCIGVIIIALIGYGIIGILGTPLFILNCFANRPCPYCMKEIPKAATVCSYCRSIVDKQV